MNNWDLMREAVQEAKNTMHAADSMANQVAGILCGRLRKVNSWQLKKLKRELSQFNSHTGKWKEEGK